jgi:Domain of unknown function (DUF4191)
MAKAQQEEKLPFREQLKRFGMVISFTAKRDRLFVPLAVAAIVVPIAAGGTAVGLGANFLWLTGSIMLAVVLAMITVNARSKAAMLREADGQPGAALSIIQTIRGDWRVHQTIAATTQQDMVHLVIGRPGVILLGEGNPQRVRGLLAQERRRLLKVIGNTDIRDYTIGNAEGQLPLGKLQVTLLKLPRTITKHDVNALDTRITALTSRPLVPRGSQGAIPKNMRPKMRGAGRPR